MGMREEGESQRDLGVSPAYRAIEADVVVVVVVVVVAAAVVDCDVEQERMDRG